MYIFSSRLLYIGDHLVLAQIRHIIAQEVVDIVEFECRQSRLIAQIRKVRLQ